MTKLSSDERKLSSAESAHQLFFEIVDHLADIGVHFHAVFHQAAGVENSTMIASAECLTNRVKRAFRHLAGQVHRDLAREGDVFRAALAGHVSQADVKMLGHPFLD